MQKILITKAEIIDKLKNKLGKDFNKDSFILITTPFFKFKSVGIKKHELEKGIYLTLLDNNGNPMFDGNIFYFKYSDNFNFIDYLYNSQYDKYMFPLWKLGDYGTIIY